MNKLPPRGIRNNNPGNLRFSPNTAWLGLTGPDGAGFCVFRAPEWGMRAMMINLIDYQRLHSITTLQGIANRWAPASDGNNPKAYAQALADTLGFPTTTEKLDWVDGPDGGDLCLRIARAITVHENGHDPYTDDRWAEGQKLVNHMWSP